MIITIRRLKVSEVNGIIGTNRAAIKETKTMMMIMNIMIKI